MKHLNNKQERNRFLKFSIVGVSGTIIDFGVMNFATLILNMPLIWAQAISFCMAVINNFTWNRKWIYPESRSERAPKQLLQFFIISIIGIIVRTPLITWLNYIFLSFLDDLSLNLVVENFVLSQNMALAVTIATILFWNFFANRYWTFGNVPIGAEGHPSPKSTITSKKR